MSIFDKQQDLENVPDQALVQLGQDPDPQYPSYLVMAEVERRRDMRQRHEAEMAKHQAANPPDIATQRMDELGGIAGVDPAMGQQPSPEDMAALQGGIAGGPPPGMEQMGGPPPDMGGPPPGMEGQPPMMAYGGLIPGYRHGGPHPDPEEWGIGQLLSGQESVEALTEQHRQERATELLAQGIEVGTPEFEQAMLDIEMQAQGWEPERAEFEGRPMDPDPQYPSYPRMSGVERSRTQRRFADYQNVMQQVRNDPTAYDYYTGRGYDLSTPQAFQDTAYKDPSFFSGKDRLKAPSFSSAAAQAGIKASGSPVSAGVQAVVDDEQAAARADALLQQGIQAQIDDRRSARAESRSDARYWADRGVGIADKYQTFASTPRASQIERREFLADEADRETDLLARELGLSTERVAELRGEMRTEKETDHARKARLFSGLGAALMGSPRNLGESLKGTTTGLEDLDEELRVERRRDLGDVYTQRAKGLSAERSGRTGIRSLRELRAQDIIAQEEAGARDVAGWKMDLMRSGMSAGTQELGYRMSRDAQMARDRLTMGQFDPARWDEWEEMYGDALRNLGDPDSPLYDQAEHTRLTKQKYDFLVLGLDAGMRNVQTANQRGLIDDNLVSQVPN